MAPVDLPATGKISSHEELDSKDVSTPEGGWAPRVCRGCCLLLWAENSKGVVSPLEGGPGSQNHGEPSGLLWPNSPKNHYFNTYFPSSSTVRLTFQAVGIEDGGDPSSSIYPLVVRPLNSFVVKEKAPKSPLLLVQLGFTVDQGRDRRESYRRRTTSPEESVALELLLYQINLDREVNQIQKMKQMPLVKRRPHGRGPAREKELLSAAPKAHPVSAEPRRIHTDVEQAQTPVRKLDAGKGIEDNVLRSCVDQDKLDVDKSHGGSMGPIVIIRGLSTVEGARRC
ncbi:Serrate RNA effector molecule [Nymphaea thermarum]|nr:Serrate RNA effector molecule [Nymphaea thermarum]